MTGERGVAIDARGLQRFASGRQILHGVSLSIEPGTLVAIVGGSGAGKTTLLDALSGVRPADRGTVLYDGVDLYSNVDRFRSELGYVPQDDIVHAELPLERSLRYTARLRLASSTTASEREAIVDHTIGALDLAERRAVKVGALSGGQRKRASVAAELLTEPRVFFLDEPTSGLDPATAAGFMRQVRALADAGSTVVMTTHSPQDIETCDRVIFLARDGHLAFVGAPNEAASYFGTDTMSDIYVRLNEELSPEEWGRRFGTAHADERPPSAAAPRQIETRDAPGFGAQWWLLSRRSFDILIRNRLTLAILLGSPVMVVLMFAVLFKRGAFDPVTGSPSAVIMILFWIAFGGFFFGLTYGLLQIITEYPIFRRERLVNLRVGAYVLSKLTVLLPLLLLVDVAMLGVLRLFDRLPAAGLDVYLSLGTTLLLDETAALCLGLLASAAVSKPDQATLALPMLCFPAVLFSGAILPVPVMATIGRGISHAMSDRYAFEGLGSALHVDGLFQRATPLGPALLAEYGDTFGRAVTFDWIVMAGFAAAFLAATCAVLVRKTR